MTGTYKIQIHSVGRGPITLETVTGTRADARRVRDHHRKKYGNTTQHAIHERWVSP